MVPTYWAPQKHLVRTPTRLVMALHNTQCPHCFTSYVISDEQYRVSEGMVRCGTCGERFQARLNPSKKPIPKVDSRSMYIEPISQQSDSTNINEDRAPISFSEIKDLVNTAAVSMQSELSIQFSDTEINDAEIDDHISTEDILANIQAKEERRKSSIAAAIDEQDNAAPQTTEPAKPSRRKATIINQQEIRAKASVERDVDVNQPEDNNDQDLINQVNQLIEDRLVKKSATAKLDTESLKNEIGSTAVALTDDEIDIETNQQEAPVTPNIDQNDDTFTLHTEKPKNSFWAWILLPILSAACIALVAILIFQLWFKQARFFDPGSEGDRLVTSVASDINEQIATKNIALPIRRDLSQLELVSARAKQHPNRPSTMLLDVGLINHAKIAQAMPWLELALYTKEGELVARRNLSPNDYSYNNDTSLMMTPREYRRLSIELLSFPKHATGYELKLLSKESSQ